MYLKERGETQHMKEMLSFRKRLTCAILAKISLLSLRLFSLLFWVLKRLIDLQIPLILT